MKNIRNGGFTGYQTHTLQFTNPSPYQLLHPSVGNKERKLKGKQRTHGKANRTNQRAAQTEVPHCDVSKVRQSSRWCFANINRKLQSSSKINI